MARALQLPLNLLNPLESLAQQPYLRPSVLPESKTQNVRRTPEPGGRKLKR